MVAAIFAVNVIAIVVLLVAAAWVYGYNFGVKETERRWSDAVSRKHG